jgi:hypothetical protein
MKYSRKLRKQKKRTRRQRGGGNCGPAYGLEGTIHRFTNYWYNTVKRDAFWGDGQEGYYYTNRKGCQNCYQSFIHTHIYSIKDLDDSPNGMKRVGWATKGDNGAGQIVQIDRGVDDMLYKDIVNWLIAKNDTVGANFPCSRV